MLRTERLRIHPLSDEEMARMVEREEDEGLKQAYGEMLAGCRANPGERLWHAVWAIEDLRGERVGNLSFKGVSADGVTELGYGIEEGHRGKGYATEAVKAMVAWAFGHAEIRVVEAETEAGNGASRRVLEKCGFEETGEIGEEGPRFRMGR
jgi:ribosomal-protein-alanine N-acetyltransferase